MDACNAGVSWLHYWVDDQGNFRYGVIDPDQITPIYDTTLDNKLVGLLRSYRELILIVVNISRFMNIGMTNKHSSLELVLMINRLLNHSIEFHLMM